MNPTLCGSAIAAACSIVILVSSLINTMDRQQMVSDLTIYLQPPIIGEGGTVILLPRPVEVEEWMMRAYGDNPAEKDEFLKLNKPLPPAAKRIGALVSGMVSIVQFDFPKGGTFQFRFAPAPGSNVPPDKLKTKQIGVGGNGEELDEKTGEIIAVGSAIHLHVAGREVTESDSRIVESEIKIGALESRYDCRHFQQVLVCDASKSLKP
jgi:hypothetical protein